MSEQLRDRTAEPASDTLRSSVRDLVRESGLKQSFIADRIGITDKHLSQLLLGRSTLTVDWVQAIVDVCRVPLRLDIEPAVWVEDVTTWRECAEQAEAERDRLRALTATCSCGGSYETYQGPEPDCSVHGAVRALNESQGEIARMRAALEEIKLRTVQRDLNRLAAAALQPPAKETHDE
jgi:transcriptional regulator with XRE-family HTH domain